jgi:hypothetical protein
LRRHDPPERAQEVERAAQIEIGDAIVFLVGVIEHQLADVNRRRRHRDVKPLVLGFDRFGEFVDRVTIARIDDMALGVRGRADYGGGGLYTLLIFVGAYHCRAERRHGFRGGLADAGCGAKNQGRLALKRKHRAIRVEAIVNFGRSFEHFSRPYALRPCSTNSRNFLTLSSPA